MQNLFIEYPKCSKCQKAKKWLEANKVQFDDRHIIENNPTEKELTEWIKISGKEIKRWFNTSGLKYKALNLKEKLTNMQCLPDSLKEREYYHPSNQGLEQKYQVRLDAIKKWKKEHQ